MRTIEFRYKKFWRIKTHAVQVPDSWKDMNAQQLIVAARAYVEHLTEEDFIAAFYGIDKAHVSQMDDFQRYRVMDLLQFVLNPDGRVNSFYLQVVDGLQAPRPKLKGMTVEHFSIVDSYFFEVAEKQTDDLMNQFVAALYLKKNESITTVDMAKRIRRVAQIDKATKYAIFLNYIFIRRWLSGAFPYLFQTDDSKKHAGQMPERIRKRNAPDWAGIIDNVVGDDVLNYERYKELDCLVFFKSINYKIKKYEQSKFK